MVCMGESSVQLFFFLNIEVQMTDCVVSRYKKNVDWAQRLNVRRCYIYDKETPENPYNIPVNKGNEASVYLKHIVIPAIPSLYLLIIPLQITV